MKVDFLEAMRRATHATRSRDLTAATRIIQNALAGRPDSERPSDESPKPRLTAPSPTATSPEEPTPQSNFQAKRKRWPLGEVLRVLRRVQIKTPNDRTPPPPPTPEDAQFLTRSFTSPSGARSYKLYIPSSTTAVRGLVVMLHGCKQNPDDFAVGTTMNAVAEAQGLIVAYPAQTGAANISHCWNWFSPADQQRDAGEPAILAGITRELAAEFGLDRRQIFVAGLSAGGAMAAVMGATYPDLYAAVGVHSGLAYRAADDVMSAFAAMKGGAPKRVNASPHSSPRVRTIVFQGEKDSTVHPVNADRVVDAALASFDLELARSERDRVEGGRRCATTVFSRADGVPLVEVWRIDGAGHAWSGGNPTGSFTDSDGPDASAEMARFFLEDAQVA